MLKQLSKQQFLSLLDDEVKAAGSQNKAAEKLGITGAHLSYVRRGEKEPGDKLLSNLGLRANTTTNYVSTSEEEGKEKKKEK